MKIIGANLCVRPSGKKLRDSGVCLIEDGELVVAVAEERITRVKHDYTIHNSIRYCLEEANAELEEIDWFVFSMCGALAPSVSFVHRYLKKSGLEIDENKIIVCPSHHLSHAASAFFASGFEESLVVVSDRDGSITNGTEHLTFANEVEHLSYYTGKDKDLQLIDRDETMVGDIGLGQGYSYVTEWLGFDGHSMAGKTMALAAYGRSHALDPAHFFSFSDSKIHCLLEPIDCNKSLAVRRAVLKGCGKDIGAHCKDYGSQMAFDVARLAQDDLEAVFLRKLRFLKEKTGMKNLCFAGGVALNCKLNYEIRKSGLFENIFIQPAAGDTGQCLGNALYGYHVVCRQPRKFVMKHAFYGKQYADQEIAAAVERYQSEIGVYKTDEPYQFIAQMLKENCIVAIFQGKSEFGPRALGHRSILASPISSEIKDILNSKIKFREWFRPFGVVVLQEYVSEYFTFNQESPYMLYAPQVNDAVRDKIAGAVHVDSSCRIQTVEMRTNPRLCRIIQAFQAETGIPVLINTSLNIQGEPIVESPEDAVKCFIHSQMDYLILEDMILFKKNKAQR